MIRCLLALFFALVVTAQDAPPQYHFVFIVDNSISMADRKPAAISAMRDLLRSGFSKQLEDGDVFDVWTFDTPNDPDPFTTLLWFNRRGGTISIAAGEYIFSKKFHRGSHIDPVLTELKSILPNTIGLFVALLTDGEEPISGFSFDAEINQEIAKLRLNAAKGKKPILVALTAVDGEWSDWRVKLPTDITDLPRLPKREKPAPPPVAAAQPTAPPEKPKEPEPQQPVVLNLPPGAKIMAAVQPQVREPVPATPHTVKTASSKSAASVQVAVTNVAPIPKGEPPPIVDVKQQKIRPEEKNPPPESKPTVQPTSQPTVSSPVETAPIAKPLALLPIVAPEPASPRFSVALIISNSSTIARTASQTDSLPARAATMSLAAAGTPVYVFMGGGGVFVLAAGAILMMRRPKAAGKASLISRSLVK